MSDSVFRRVVRNENVRLAALVLVVLVPILLSDALGRANLLIYDLSLRSLARPPRADIVIVAVDEQSLQDIGRWPWSRRVHARLVERLTRFEARSVTLDILFAEPESGDPGADVALGEAIATNGRVALAVAPVRLGGAVPIGELEPLRGLAEVAARLGHVDVPLDQDAVARGAFLHAGMGSPAWPALALAAAEIGATSKPDTPARLLAPAPADVKRRWVREHHVLVPFIGPAGTFARLSYSEVLANDDVAATVRGKHVLVGPTAAGVAVALPTPVSGTAEPMPGVEYNASVLQAVLDQAWIRPLHPAASVVITLALVLLPLLAYRRLSARSAFILWLLALVGTVSCALALIRFGRLWFAPAPALAGLLLGYALWSWRRLEANLRELVLQTENDRATLNSIGDAVVRTDLQAHIRYMNPVAERLSSLPPEQALHRDFREVFQAASNDDRARMDGALDAAVAEGAAAQTTQCSLRDRSGAAHYVQLTVGGVPDAKGHHAGLVLAMSDMTTMVSLTQELAHQAMHDFLTQLPNRQLLMDRINQALHIASRTRELVAVLFFDLDGFKRINDSLGHAGGDHVLREVARRLTEARRAGDTVARFGGDEFVIVLEGMQRQAPIGTIARKTLARLAAPLAYRNQEIFVTASIGIAVYPADGTDAETLLKNADTAMYRVKRQTRNGFRFHSEEVNRFTVQHLALERAMRYALRRNEFELFYQPQIRFATGRIVGVEALLRWHHPEAGLMLPSSFIPVAEEAGLIDEIGLWTLKQACQQLREWTAQGLGEVTVAINVSPRQMLHANMMRSLERVLRESRVDAGLMKLEIVETAVMHDIERVEGILKQVRALGAHVSIDDFGTGYSSLTHIRRLPVDEVKIDQSFVRGINDNANDAAITQAVIAMAHSIGLSVVAEGVENETQLAFLRERGCDEWQGFLFSGPLPAAEIAACLAAERAKAAPSPRGMTI